jgi:hypothetical protein
MRRPGITLLEVLSAIFITGIGLLSLLTLFPLGALKMLEAINDDRTALAGGNAKGIANAVEMRVDPAAQNAMMGNTMFPGPMPPSPDGPGWPVLVDPIGVLAYSGPTLFPAWVAGDNTIAMIPRVTGNWLKPLPTDVSASQAVLRWCTLLDDLNFNYDSTNNNAYLGSAAVDVPAWFGGIGTVQRNLRYSYAWLLRMPRTASPNVVDVSALVFAGRSLDLVGFGTQERMIPQATFVPTFNQIILPPVNGQPVDLRRGQWILDASNAVTNGTPQMLISAHGFFYRIVSVSDPDANANVTVEVQTPLRQWPDPNMPVSPLGGQLGTVVLFDNLIEVFEDGTF